MLDGFLKRGLVSKGRSYNPAVQLSSLFNPSETAANDRVYSHDDPLGRIFRPFLPSAGDGAAEVRAAADPGARRGILDAHGISSNFDGGGLVLDSDSDDGGGGSRVHAFAPRKRLRGGAAGMASAHEPLLVGGSIQTAHLSKSVAEEMDEGPVPRPGYGTRSSGWFPKGRAGDLEALAPKPMVDRSATPRESRYRPYYDINRAIAVPPVSGYARWAPVTGVYAGTDGHISVTDADRRAWMARTQMAAVPDSAQTSELFKDPYDRLRQAYRQNRAPRVPRTPVVVSQAPMRLLGGGALENPGLSAAPMTQPDVPGDPTFQPREDLSSQWEALKIVPGNISGNYVVAAPDPNPPAAHVIDLSSDEEGPGRVVPAPTAQTVEGAAAAAPLDMLPGASPTTPSAPGAPADPAGLAAGGALGPQGAGPSPGVEAASSLLGGAGTKRKRRPRAPGVKADRRNALVGKLMREHGLSLAAASKKVREDKMEY